MKHHTEGIVTRPEPDTQPPTERGEPEQVETRVICRDEFLRELQSLLERYDAEITAQDHWTGYAECGQDIRMTIEFNDWQIEDINIGRWIDKEKHGGR